ncbi:rod shape-determining protein MreC [Formivibrio citricus]|uniref:Cell shape-determining protein MreC n=1 Tax=Formivibrio citricus TaxID=83765 RepID=A0A1I5D2V4_9NEIS|nr:rod shape-determining protein MreC [Formivibrio citricus]SFN93568.1 rod shape-determining protein MreC [Formivibrio citricus]
MQSTQPAFFKQGPKPATRLAIFAVLSLALMAGDTRYHMLGVMRQQVSVALYPLQWLATAPFTLFRTSRDFLTRQADLLEENRQLNDAQLSATALAQRVKQLEQENIQLRGLNEAQRTLPKPSQLAEILYNSRDAFAAKLILNRGETHGITAGRIVADASGLVGQIVRVQPMTSEIRLLTDNNHMVPVVVERNQLRTVVYGRGREQALEVRNMASNVDIQPGDILVTSGIDGLYPAGLPVAKVENVDRQSAFARIFCSPLAGIGQHRFLLVLEEASPLPPYPTAASAPAAAGKKKRKGH